MACSIALVTWRTGSESGVAPEFGATVPATGATALGVYFVGDLNRGILWTLPPVKCSKALWLVHPWLDEFQRILGPKSKGMCHWAILNAPWSV